MDTVFVWKGYGEIDVFRAETPEELASIFEKIVSCLDGWGLEDSITQWSKEIEDFEHSYKIYKFAINELLEKTNIGSHEMFEYGTGFEKLQ